MFISAKFHRNSAVVAAACAATGHNCRLCRCAAGLHWAVASSKVRERVTTVLQSDRAFDHNSNSACSAWFTARMYNLRSLAVAELTYTRRDLTAEPEAVAASSASSGHGGKFRWASRLFD